MQPAIANTFFSSKMKSLMRYFNKTAWPKSVFLALCLAGLLFNLTQSWAAFSKQQRVRSQQPYIFLGFKYLGLSEFFAAGSRVGYLTDRDQEQRANAMEFAQAEYILAPVTLDLNNAEHEYLILAFSSPQKTLQAIKEKKLIPLKQNKFGIILAKNPRWDKK
jgi:hypothetical protein